MTVAAPRTQPVSEPGLAVRGSRSPALATHDAGVRAPQPPPFLVAVGLLFWGHAAGFLPVAVAMAIALEAPRWMRARWDFENRDFERVADLCGVAFAVLVVYQRVVARNFPDGVLAVLTWLPMIFCAVLLMQRFGARGDLPLTALFWSMRRRARAGLGPSKRMALDYAYFCLCIVSAACANPRSPWFFPAIVWLATYALVTARPQGRRLAAWGVTLAVAVGGAWLLQRGLVRAHEQIENYALEFLRERLFGRADGFRATTAIGDIGRVKLSDRVVMRVSGVTALPVKLRDGVYNAFAHDSWFAHGAGFEPVRPEGDDSWTIAAGRGPGMRISAWLRRGAGVLALPAGTYRLDGLNVGRVERNGLGAVRVAAGPDLVTFTARYALQGESEQGPDHADLAIPERLREPLDRVLHEAGVNGSDPEQAVQRLVAFFEHNYTYTTELAGSEGVRRTLERFLVADRRGHCEYFATATALLLRRAGIPARYVTGYLVEEWSPLERQYLVRARHGHAWTLAWIDGRWREVDATPSGWLELERDAQAPWQRALDLLSWLGFRFESWRAAEPEPETGVSAWWLLLVVPLAGWVAWRVTRRARRDHSPAAGEPKAGEPQEEAIASLLARLAELGFTRPPGQPLRPWLTSLALPDEEARTLAVAVAQAHARLRFDPRGLAPEEAAALRQWLVALQSRLAASPRTG
jgi:transglutaminase-like putative cysteine protease